MWLVDGRVTFGRAGPVRKMSERRRLRPVQGLSTTDSRATRPDSTFSQGFTFAEKELDAMQNELKVVLFAVAGIVVIVVVAAMGGGL